MFNGSLLRRGLVGQREGPSGDIDTLIPVHVTHLRTREANVMGGHGHCGGPLAG
jgi:hypothetical protein